MILNVYAMYFQTKLISSFVVSYLLLLSFLERKWTNFLISQGRFKDLSFGRPLQDLPSHHSYFRFLIIESGHISQLNLQANFFNLTSLIKQTFYEIDWRHNWSNLNSSWHLSYTRIFFTKSQWISIGAVHFGHSMKAFLPLKVLIDWVQPSLDVEN